MNRNNGYAVLSSGNMGASEKAPRGGPPHYLDQQQQQSGVFRVVRGLNEAHAMKNLMAVSSRDFSPSTKYAVLDESFIFNVVPAIEMDSGCIGPSRVHRMWAQLSLNQQVSLRPFNPFEQSTDVYLSQIEIEASRTLSFFSKNQEVRDNLSVEELADVVTKTFAEQAFSMGQIFIFDFHGINIKGLVTSFNVMNLNDIKSSGVSSNNKKSPFGILIPQTEITFSKAGDSNIQLKGGNRSRPANKIIQHDFKFEDMGIGGLDAEFSNIFRRAFASRIFPPDLIDKLGIQHVKGILLYGPPGTGKTLMARQIGKMLNSVEPIIVNGPEILNKFVGQSEENIRKLFSAAEKEYKEKGDDSQLHIIIFDELDAIVKQRGGRSDSTGVGDSVVNQLLSKMDGVDQLNNILIIGMTNRKDLIDEALTRPGRLEVQIEVGLPDENGRLQILGIHTHKMRENNILGPDVNLEELAATTRNFSGAEIAGLIKSASSFAFNRHTKVGTLAGVEADISKFEITRDDFMGALDEVRPAFGTSEEELSRFIQNHIIPYSPIVNELLDDGRLYIEQVRKSENSPLLSLLLHGLPATGKTALAATLAMRSEFPFCKLISSESMVGYSESAKIAEINKVFTDSYRSPLSVIVVDDIERLIEWVPIGPRFSNSILQTLLVLLRKQPPKNHRLLVIATSNQRAILDELGFMDVFDTDMLVPQITSWSAVEQVLRHFELFDDRTTSETIEYLEQNQQMLSDQNPNNLYINKSASLKIGIKKLLLLMETARQDTDVRARFIQLISQHL